MAFEKIIRLTQPSAEPVTLAEAKDHLRFDGTQEDAYITAVISAARDYIETYTGHYWASATFALIFTNFPAADNPMGLAIPDIESIDEITYLDTSQDTQTITTGTTLDSERRWLLNDNAWPTDEISVRIAVTAGKDFAASPVVDFLPEGVKQAILLTITDLYNNRATLTTMQTYRNLAAEMLAYPYRTRMGI